MSLSTQALLTPDARLRVLTSDGAIAPGAKLYTYVAGSSTTPQLTYSDRTLATPNTNPVVADSAGLLSAIYLSFGVAYHFILKDSAGNVIWDQDYVSVGGVQQSLFNVRTYGAVGNGIADDTVAIQAAITAAQTAGGGVVWFPIGTYRITAQITVRASNIRLEGENQAGSKIVVDDNVINGVIKVSPSTVATTHTASLATDAAIGARTVDLAAGEGLNFSVGEYVLLSDSDANNGAMVTLVDSIAVDTITLRDTLTAALATARSATMKGWPNGPMVGFGMRNLTVKCTSDAPTNIATLVWVLLAKDALVQGCSFSGATGALFLYDTCLNCTITNCNIENGLGASNAGINMNDGSCGCSVVNNTVTHTAFGITTAQAPRSRIIGNVIHQRQSSSVSGRGLKLQSGSNFSTVAGNVISDYRLYGIYLQDDAYCTVSGNSIFRQGADTDPGEHGIQIGGFETAACHHNAIVGNTIVQASGWGISITPTSATASDLYNVIVGNNISKCRQGGIIVFGANYNTIEGNFVSCPTANLQLASLIWTGGGVGPIAQYNFITGNTVVTEDAAVVGINTASSGGHNRVTNNFLGPTVTQSTAATDATQPTLTVPMHIDGPVATGADTTETTAADFTIPAGTFVQAAAGFILKARFSFGADANNKTITLYLGTATAAKTAAPNSNFGYLDVTVTVVTSAHLLAIGWLTFTDGTAILLFGDYFLSSTDNWANVQHVKLTMTNGVAVAGDITFSEAILVPFGSPSTAYAF